MRRNVWRNGCSLTPASLGHVSLVLLLQFLFQFAQGQGPGQTHFTVYENLDPGTLVGTISTQPFFTYSFSEDSTNNAQAYFNLDRNTGVIKTKVRLDRESLNLQGDQFDILVIAHSSDRNYPVEISVEVLDKNDNDPVIPSKNFTIRENIANGTKEPLDTATDADKGPNARVDSYEIVSGEGPFELVYDPQTFGESLSLKVTGSLDRELNSFYTLTILARDNGTPQRTGTATVNIEITDMNDNPPIFDPSTYYAHVNETDSNGTLVIQVNATDPDTGSNQIVTYRFIDGNQDNQFRIDENTGKIFTNTEPLSCPKQCQLTVEAQDHGIPSYTGRGFVYITVEDINNHDPVIRFRYVPSTNTEFSSINEDARDGENVAGVVIQDLDQNGNTEPVARIIAGNELNHFRFQRFITGQYFVQVNGDSVLDRQRYHKYNLTIEANDGGSPPRTSTAFLILYVNDINDNAPQFTNNLVKLRISEMTPVGSFIASMLATDLDVGINAQLTYAILSGNDRGWFHINSKTGLVTTITNLQFNIQNTFKMNISVHDGALNPLKDYAELDISIWDENNMAPRFSQSIFNVSLEETKQSGTLVVSASAVDYDSTLNGSVVYAFHPHVQQLYPDTFYLDTSSGRVTTRKTLDREQVSDYIIRIIAHDEGPVPLSSTATVYLKVGDINDNSPVFYPKIYKAKILEGQNIGTFVAQVTATDLDEGDNGEIIYSITGTDYNKFEIDSSTGVITTRQVLRKGDGNSYVLNIMARDKFGDRSDTTSVTVLVLSPTDFQVRFVSNLYSFSIPEDPGKQSRYLGVNVGSVRAEYSADGSLSYSIAGGDSTEVFTIDTSTGWIRRSKAIDREIFPEFDLKVVASATDTFAETVVHIKITDVNDMAPEFEFPVVEVDLIENWPVGHHIMVASAADADEPGDNSRVVYSLQNDANNLFGINSNTGLVYLNKPLKLLQKRSINVTVVAIDSGDGTNRATQELRMNVKDVNNHSPRFAHSTYQISLIESHPVNSRFYDVAAIDNDMGVNGELIFNITRGNEDGKFGVFPDGYLYIRSPLDRETKDLYKLGIRATDKGVQQRSSECNITVHITDFNDNKPMFLNSSYTFEVMENKPANLFVGHVKASDDDVGRNAELSYYFTNGTADFKLDSQTGELITMRTFDREAYSSSDFSIPFDVVVKDSGFERLQDVALVRVKILDENDNAPVFRQPVYKVTVFENSARFSNVTVVKADDADAGINRIVTYDIISGNEEDNFMIDHTTGQISLNKKLDRETEDYYELKILATDSGEHVRHNDTTVVKITVSDINDNFPLFAQSQMDINVKEDLMPGTMVAHFPATDTDLGINAEITYTMSGIDDDKTFSIDRHTGKIYLLKTLDFERKKSYKLNVTATDSGVPPLPYYIRFSISIEDVNDNPPVFQNEPIVFSIMEEAVGTVGYLTAVDADVGSNGEVQYFITFQDPPGDNFNVVKGTGQIYNVKQIDREVYDMVTLTVMAVDKAENPSKRLSSATRVTIYINDTNDNSPEITSFNAVTVTYGTPVNEFVATIQSTDKDIGDNGRVSLQLRQNSSLFGLDSDTGRFYVNRVIPSTPVTHELQVQANDYGVSTRSTLFDMTIIITDNVDGPVFQSSSYSGSVTENSVKGLSILRVLANSRRGSPVEYYITNITDSNSDKQVRRIFNVNKSSGVLSTAEVLDREELGSGPFDLTIYAVDTTGDRPRTTFVLARISLLDQNDTPPRFSQNFYSVNVDEDVRVDFPVTKIAVYDDDSTGGLQLTINATSDVNLRIRPDGTLLTSGPLDREQQSRYTLQVTATDGKQSSTCVVRVNVLDKNDMQPEFERSFYSFDIDEDTKIETTVGAVRAHDADIGENGMVTYSLKSGWGNDTFALDPIKGTFTLLSSLHFEQTQLFTLVVMATDNGASPLSSSVTVYFNVKDINDNKPIFELGSYTPAVKEDVAIGTSVVQVVALDVDSGVNGQVQYAITDGDLDQHFAIEPNTGTIVTNATLDRETTPMYSLVITASDKAILPDQRLSSTVEVSVTILDVNDYTPVFVSPSTIHVRENTALSTIIHKVIVRDLDEGANADIRFSITSKTGGTPFTISPSDGSIRVNTELDRESVQNFTMNVTAMDRGSPTLSASQTLLIIIEDENDQAPIFSPAEYSSAQPENVKIGSTLLQVSATDLDVGDNGIVRFYIIAGDENHDFSLDQSSGVLRVQKDLDYERVTQYILIVQAEDGGDKSLSATATVSVEVTDINDNMPVFSDSPFIGIVLENMQNLPVHILNVVAHDDDSSPFNQLSYAIREGDKSLFNISATTGEIMALRTLDREAQAEYMLTVIATDSLTGRGLTGSGTVSIFVEDVNDNPPMFEHNGTYVAHILENSPPHSEVITVQATDKDEGENAQIMYSLLNNLHQFHILPDTGRISTLLELDREKVSEYTVTVVAQDSSMLPLSSTTTVKVYVDDVNDNPPVFDAVEYSRMMLPAGSGTFVLGVTASDADIGDNGLLEYTLSTQTYADLFELSAQTGVITLKQTVSPGQKFSFQVVARDKGSPSLSTTVSVNITIATSSSVTPPAFSAIAADLSVRENAELNKNIVKLRATSSNGASIKYRIAGGNTGQSFRIGPTDGQLTVARVIDYEATTVYHLWVEAYTSDTPSLSNFAEVVIQVVDENDNSPRFEAALYNVSVRENSPIGSSVVQVTAIDPDSGIFGDVSYSLQGSEAFFIDPSSGQISTFTQSLDRETTDMYSLLVVASDNGTPRRSSTASIRVSITDENDSPPRFERQFNVKIPENTEVGSFVIRVTTTDKDILENAIATYTLTDDASGFFMIDSQSGNITLKKPLDAEVKSSYSLRVSASDSAHDVGGNVEVEVSDVNDNSPVLLQRYSFNFEEMKPPGSFVGQLKATDADISSPNNRTYFSLKQTSSYFDLNSENGRIISLEELTFDPTMDPLSLPNRHEFVVITKDLGTPVRSSETTVYINIVDYNDHSPVFEETNYKSAVPDNTVVGNSILTVVARDEYDFGVNREVEYFLAGGNGSQYFDVDRYSGMITVTRSVVNQRGREYMVFVRAEDKGTPAQSATAQVHLVITGQNQYAPQFRHPASNQISVPEDKAVGSLIETFSATDDDTGLNAEIEFEITGGDIDNLFDMEKDTGKLLIKAALDYERAHDYTLNITAKDKGLYSKSTTMGYLVRLTDVNDNDPVFAQTSDIIYVEENIPRGSSIYHAVATDADDTSENARITYAIVEDAKALITFNIDGNTGVITTKDDLDYESLNLYSLTIMAHNMDSSRKSTMFLQVNIEGVNEYVPRFTQDTYYMSVSESAEEKTSVGTVIASDNDAGQDGIVYYFLIGDSNTKGFKVDARSGVIYVSGRPDYESSPEITLKVLAKNWGSVKGNDTDTCMVHISVQDANDPPVFTPDVYDPRILENSPAGTFITTVTAADYDFDSNDRKFSYRILNGNSKNMFQINSETGRITTTGRGILDRELDPVITIVVGAVDTGTPPETGSATVNVHLDDVNDNGPSFTNFTASVLENQAVATLVTNLRQFTTDPDEYSSNPSLFTYQRVPGTDIVEYSYFDIRTSGDVVTARALDHETIKEFIVPVVVNDGGSPLMSSTLSFRITVQDLNDNPPEPRGLTLFLSLYDGQVPINAVADVKPLDKDETGTYTCDLTSTSTPFAIQPNSCDMIVKSFPDKDFYSLKITGNDGIPEHPAAIYDITVRRSVFNNQTMAHSAIIQLASVSADSFMKNSYNKFIAAIQNLFESEDEVIILSLTEQSEELLVFLAVYQDTIDQYYSPGAVKQNIELNKGSIGTSSSVYILEVGYSTCSSSSCSANQKCESRVSVSPSGHIADSPHTVFSYPELSLGHYCVSQCGSTYCLNDGLCINNKCSCPSTWTGSSCEIDINECPTVSCQNGASCVNKPGSFYCDCPDGFSGTYCERGQDNCVSNPCTRGTCKNTEDGYQCLCPFGYFGNKCELSSKGFSVGSFMKYERMPAGMNNIEVVFSTLKDTALLLYNPSDGLTEDFTALEILKGRLQFSLALRPDQPASITMDTLVSTGHWFKVNINRTGNFVQMWVSKCPADGGACGQCPSTDTCYREISVQGDGSLDVGSHPMYFAGVKNISTVLQKSPSQVRSHDFVGCVRSFFVNGEDKLSRPQERTGVTDTCPRSSAADPCSTLECKNGGSCGLVWPQPVCHCTPAFYGQHCEKELQPFGFGVDSLVKISPREDARRDLQVEANTLRRRRAVATPTQSDVMVRFRTTATDGLLLFTSNLDSNRYTALGVANGYLTFQATMFGGNPRIVQITTTSVNDGNWHNATVSITATTVTLLLDNQHQQADTIQAFMFTSLEVKELLLGGATNAVTIDTKSVKDFDGCISVFHINGKALPLNGTTDFYNVEAVGGVKNGCDGLCVGVQCDGGSCTPMGEVAMCQGQSVTEDKALSIGIIVVIVFFGVLIIAIIVVFVVFRQRGKRLCLPKKEVQKQNGTMAMSKSANSSGHSHQDSGYGENNIDELIIRNHIAQELKTNNMHHGNGRLVEPDLIGTERTRSHLPYEIEDGTVIIDNASDLTNLRDLHGGEAPELYDLENASSIAPSDIDVVDHYRHFHDGGRSRRKNKPNSHHSSNHHSQHSSRQYGPGSNHSNSHSHKQMRDSPNLLSSVPYMNDLARNSPAISGRGNHSPINQLSRQSPNVRQSPLTHVNMQGMPVTDLNTGSRTTSEHSLASHRSKNSGTPHKPVRQMLPNGNSNRKINNNYENKQFLTLEEVDRLNSRPRESPASLMEAFSTSSENNTRKMKKPFEKYQDTSVLLEPPESSSDDSANDSFTCSEFEYENDKQKSDFTSKFSNLDEVDNENEDGAYHNKVFKSDGLDSGGNSFSSNVGSSDESQSKSKDMSTHAFNWDDLLNWGPKFEKLVGVFTDIALLPDADNVNFSEVEGKVPDQEEYV